jgi:hypothetical protein
VYPVVELEKKSWAGQCKKKHTNMFPDTPLPIESYDGVEGSSISRVSSLSLFKKKLILL